MFILLKETVRLEIFTNMVAKSSLKLITNIAINIILFTIYCCLFGKKSIEKYFDNGVSIVNQEEETSVLVPPGSE